MPALFPGRKALTSTPNLNLKGWDWRQALAAPGADWGPLEHPSVASLPPESELKPCLLSTRSFETGPQAPTSNQMPILESYGSGGVLGVQRGAEGGAELSPGHGPPGSFSASPATSLPLLKGKKKLAIVPKGISMGRSGRRERFTHTYRKENSYLIYYIVLIPNENIYYL